MDVLPFIQQQHSSQITYSFVSKLLRGDQLQALQLENKPLGHNWPQLWQPQVLLLFRHTWPKWAGYPSMCIYKSFATFLHRYVLSSSRKEERMAAHSFWIISRSSAWVRAVRMVRISSRNLIGAGILWKNTGTRVTFELLTKSINLSHLIKWLLFKHVFLWIKHSNWW